MTENDEWEYEVESYLDSLYEETSLFSTDDYYQPQNEI